jgi:hypothetical protein
MTELSQLADQFHSESEKNQLSLIPQLVALGDAGLQVLRDFLLSENSSPVNFVKGKALQAIYQANNPENQEFLKTHFTEGIVPLYSERNFDYHPLQQALLAQDYQTADTITRQNLCELVGEGAIKRQWLYFTEVEKIPSRDLLTINQLWSIYSEGKFGYQIQRQIWLSLGQDFTKLWAKIGWKNGNQWTQYPKGFTWDLSAPLGHLPLSNQLRGVRVISALFAHPAWSKE